MIKCTSGHLVGFSSLSLRCTAVMRFVQLLRYLSYPQLLPSCFLFKGMASGGGGETNDTLRSLLDSCSVASSCSEVPFLVQMLFSIFLCVISETNFNVIMIGGKRGAFWDLRVQMSQSVRLLCSQLLLDAVFKDVQILEQSVYSHTCHDSPNDRGPPPSVGDGSTKYVGLKKQMRLMQFTLDNSHV